MSRLGRVKALLSEASSAQNKDIDTAVKDLNGMVKFLSALKKRDAEEDDAIHLRAMAEDLKDLGVMLEDLATDIEG